MKLIIILMVLFVFFMKDGANCETSVEAVQKFFRYFDKKVPVGIPVLEPPEPMPLPELYVYPVIISDGLLYGHSKTVFHRICFDLKDLKGTFNISIPTLVLLGYYNWTFVSESEGFIQLDSIDMDLNVSYTMKVNKQDIPELSDFELEDILSSAYFNLTGLSRFHQAYFDTGFVNIFYYEMIDYIIDQLKPLIINKTNKYTSGIFNSIPFANPKSYNPYWKLRATPTMFFLMRVINYFGADPLPITQKIEIKSFFAYFKFSEISIKGLSHLKKINNLSFTFKEETNKVYLYSSVVFERLLTKAWLKTKALGFIRDNRPILLDVDDASLDINLTFDMKQRESPKLLHFHFKIGRVENTKKTGLAGLFNDFFSKKVKNMFNEYVREVSWKIKGEIQDMLDKSHLEHGAIKFLKSSF